MTKKLFGTDGIRGRANTYPLTPDMTTKIGMAIGTVLKRKGHKNNIVIGKDTRLSCYMLENAICAGLNSVGIDVLLLGPIPTPGLAMITKTMNNDIGIMISASHNPYYDNGIKLFDTNGIKFPDKIEEEIEKCIEEEAYLKELVIDDKIGRRQVSENALYQQRYIQYIKCSSRTVEIDFKIGLDTANGASYKVAPIIFSELGAKIFQIGNTPNGININEKCGSTDTKQLTQLVIDNGCDIGIAVDGDADRCILIDENGNEIDGDKIIALITKDYLERGKLKGNAVVTTQMSNYGFEEYINSLGLNLIRTKVGDRYVAEEMRKNGYNVGGEQSGHIILGDYSTTGDGIMTALNVLTIMKEKGLKASQISNLYQTTPQILKNVEAKTEILENKELKELITFYEKQLEGNGRLLIRKSGTQPLIRVMAEGNNEKSINEIVDKIIDKISDLS
ncbi:MAG: phosphoglucosamine mutase [Rickettsiales bacterium]|jgi:phosphoglucosamine mutase|nr:phosphoglucosamine mutase [Rickettsiales bacterium]